MTIQLNGTTESLELETTIAGDIDVTCGFVDTTSTVASLPTNPSATITTATTTVIVAAPSASTLRKVLYLSIYNNGTPQLIKLAKDVSATPYYIYQGVLQTGESIIISQNGFKIYDSSGREKQQNSEQNSIIGGSMKIFKIGTAPKEAGAYYSSFKDSGINGAWAIGTPGLNGLNIDNSAAFKGLYTIPTPASGANYLRDVNISATVACGLRVVDLLWYNSGIVATTTAAQAIIQPTLPARDINGTTDGKGVFVAMYFSSTSTNGVITNTQLQYTNSDGVAGRVATISSVNAAATIGQWFMFQLQAGDVGVRSIQSITLGTTYVSGTIHLFCFRPLQSISVLAVNSGASASSQQSKNLDTRLYDGSALSLIQLASATTATTIDGDIYLINK